MMTWLAIVGLVAYLAVERHGRARWRSVPVGHLRVGAPYRQTEVAHSYRARAPISVRGAAFSSAGLGIVGIGALMKALPRLHLEGIAVSLVVAACVSIISGACGVFAVAPSKLSLEVTSLAIGAAAILYLGLLFMAALHAFNLNGAGEWADGVTVRAAVVLAALGLSHGGFLSWVMRAHRDAFEIAARPLP